MPRCPWAKRSSTSMMASIVECNVSLDSSHCELNLVRRLRAKKNPQNESAFENGNGAEDLLHVFESKDR